MPETVNPPAASAAKAATAAKPGRGRSAKVQADGAGVGEQPKKAAPSPAQQALQKLGLKRDIDLALHLPLRYEDETRITPLRNARDGDTVQIEATVTHNEIQLRPRRMLKVTVDDGTGECVLTFFSFYFQYLFES